MTTQELNRQGRVFAKHFSSAIEKAGANTAYVNPEYFKPVYENVMGADMPEGTFDMDGMTVKPTSKIKKFVFVKEEPDEDGNTTDLYS